MMLIPSASWFGAWGGYCTLPRKVGVTRAKDLPSEESTPQPELTWSPEGLTQMPLSTVPNSPIPSASPTLRLLESITPKTSSVLFPFMVIWPREEEGLVLLRLEAGEDASGEAKFSRGENWERVIGERFVDAGEAAPNESA